MVFLVEKAEQLLRVFAHFLWRLVQYYFDEPVVLGFGGCGNRRSVVCVAGRTPLAESQLFILSVFPGACLGAVLLGKAHADCATLSAVCVGVGGGVFCPLCFQKTYKRA